MVGGAAVAPDGALDAVDVGAEFGGCGEVLGAGGAVVVDGRQGAIVAEELFGRREVHTAGRALVVVLGLGFMSC